MCVAKTANKILPVLILYNQSLEESKSYESLFKGKHIPCFIYDNSPVCHEIPDSEKEYIHYEHTGENIGLSRVYNLAAKYAAKKGFSWILLLDQDTEFSSGAWGKYLQSIKKNPEDVMFVPKLLLKSGKLFSPCLKYRRCHLWGNKINDYGQYNLSSFFAVNSGMLIRLDAFMAVGGYNDKVFLDFADMQFCQRLSTQYDHFTLINVVGEQNFSDNETDVTKLLTRYKLYLKSYGSCIFLSYKDHIYYFVDVLLHTIKLAVRTTNISFAFTFFKFIFGISKL